MEPSRRAFLGTVAVTVGLAGCTGSPGPGNQPTETSTPESTPTAEPMDTPTATPTSAATVQVADHPEYGDILVDAEGLSLYLFTRDTQGEGASTCSGQCADAWPPLTVTDDPTAGDGVTATLSTFERDSGDRQVAAGGWPLYYFASDEAPGDTKGQGVGDVWWLVAPDGTAVQPSGSPTPERSPTSSPTESYY